MKLKSYLIVVFATTIFTACGQRQTTSVDDMLKDPQQQERLIDEIVKNHELSKIYINKMINNDHTVGMMIEGIVKAADEDTLLANKLSNLITQHPDLMLLTVHHFMPVVNADEHLCDDFCNHAMEHQNISEEMCHKIHSSKDMKSCH